MKKKPVQPAAALLLPPQGDPARKWALCVMALAPFCFGLYALYLGADASWDLRNYHWYNAWAYLTGRHDSGVDFLPSQSQFFLNPWMDLPFYWLATHAPPRVAGFVLGTVQGLNFPLVFMIAYLTLVMDNTRYKTATCAALAAMGCLSAMGISEIGTVFYDNVTSLGILLTTLLVLRRLDLFLKEPVAKAAGLMVLFGLPAGLMVGLKMTCATFCTGECFALLVASNVSRRGFLLAFFLGIGFLLGYAITYGHWGAYLFTHYDSPTFPLFNKFFHAPLIPAESVGDFMLPPGIEKWIHPLLFGINPYLVNEIWWQDWRMPVFYVLLIVSGCLTLFYGKRPEGGPIAEMRAARYLLWMAAASYFTWISVEAVYRYLMPLDMLAPLLIVICIGMLPWTKKIRFEIAVSVLVALMASMQPGDWGRRGVWPEHVADVTCPDIPDAKDTLVLMAGYDAYAFMLPEFPPELSYLRIESRTFRPAYDLAINRVIQEKIDDHKGRLMLFMPARDLKQGEKALDYYHLELLPKTCRKVTDNLYEERLDKPEEMQNDYPDAYKLCDVARIRASKK